MLVCPGTGHLGAHRIAAGQAVPRHPVPRSSQELYMAGVLLVVTSIPTVGNLPSRRRSWDPTQAVGSQLTFPTMVACIPPPACLAGRDLPRW